MKYLNYKFSEPKGTLTMCRLINDYKRCITYGIENHCESLYIDHIPGIGLMAFVEPPNDNMLEISIAELRCILLRLSSHLRILQSLN